MIILGNDLAKYQGDVNFDVYKNNSNFVIIKATEGNGYIDPKFKRNQSEARRVGLPLGYYHFARPDLGNSPEVEADFYLKTLGEVRDGEILTLDYECPNQVQAHVEWCKKFMERVALKLNGLKCLIYLNQAQLKTFDWSSIVNDGYGLWVACYTYDPNKNNFFKGQWKTVAMQQWTNKQTVPGIPTPADGNVFFGDLTTLKKYGYKKPSPKIDLKDQLISDLKKEVEDLKKTLASNTQAQQEELAKVKADCLKKTRVVTIKLDEIKSIIES